MANKIQLNFHKQLEKNGRTRSWNCYSQAVQIVKYLKLGQSVVVCYIYGVAKLDITTPINTKNLCFHRGFTYWSLLVQ